jgi:hypothetical protein
MRGALSPRCARLELGRAWRCTLTLALHQAPVALTLAIATASILHTVPGPTQVLGAQVYACGGHQGACYHRSVERYSPGALRWEAMPPMRAERSGPGVAAVGGLLYAVGGTTVRGDFTVSKK